MEILGTQNSECHESFWFKLGELGERGAFEKKAVFEGLCEVMVKVAERQEAGKGLQNLTYSEKYSDFIAVLSSLNTRAYNVFQQNLVGQTIQNIR